MTAWRNGLAGLVLSAWALGAAPIGLAQAADETPAMAALDAAGETAMTGPKGPPCPPLLDEETGEPLVDEATGRRLYDESLVPVIDTATGEAMVDAETGEPVTEACIVPGPKCPPLLNEETGAPVLDEMTGQPLYDESPVAVLDPETGEPVSDPETGEPVTEACVVPAAASDRADGAGAEAMAGEEAQTALSPIVRLLEAGGPVIVILAVLAVLALGVGLVKLIQFLWLGVGRAGFVHPLVDDLRAGDTGDVLDRLEARRNPVARVMAAAVRGRAHPAMSEDLVREETTRVANAQLDGLERGLSLLSLIATIAPLLGLLGTVLGMIEAFQQMETVGDRVEPAVLAGGIWEALLTTAAGLSVAIPAAVLFSWFQRAVDVEGQRMEDAATQVFTLSLYDGVTRGRAAA